MCYDVSMCYGELLDGILGNQEPTFRKTSWMTMMVVIVVMILVVSTHSKFNANYYLNHLPVTYHLSIIYLSSVYNQLPICHLLIIYVSIFPTIYHVLSIFLLCVSFS